MLTIDLRRLEQAPLEVRGEIAVDDPLWEGTGVELSAPLAVRAIADGSAERGVWLRGTLSSRVRSICRRCLEPVEIAVSEEFGVLFDPKTPESDGDLTVYALDPRAEELDLRAALRERLLLAMPDYPVCREACRGLCPSCGANWNDEQCVCGGDEPDPRWSPLQALRGER